MKYGELKWVDVEAMDKSNKVVVVPLGSLEQHGHHLPMLTDSILGGEIVRRVEEALPDTVLLTPMLWLGSSDHHRKFPGTISVNSALYIDMVCDVLNSVIDAGFSRIVLHISHGGNTAPCREAIYRVGLQHRQRDDLWIASVTYWDLASDAMKTVKEMETPRLTHACEYETSMVLHLRAELVDLSRAKGVTAHQASNFYFPDFSQSSKLDISLPFERMTTTGAMLRPDLANAEKGAKLFDAISARVMEFVKEFATWGKLRLE
jgi:creatinine amidohydrolase